MPDPLAPPPLDPPPGDTAPRDPAATAPYPSRLRDPHAWLWAGVGVALIAMGIYFMTRAKAGVMHVPAWFWIGAGLCAMPLVPLGVLGAIVLLAYAGWMLKHALGPIDYIYIVIAVFFALSRLLEAWQHHKARRRV